MAGAAVSKTRARRSELVIRSTIARVMEGRTLAIGAYNARLDDAFRIVAQSEAEREEIRRGMESVESRINSEMDPLLAAPIRLSQDEGLTKRTQIFPFTPLLRSSRIACRLVLRACLGRRRSSLAKQR